MRSSSALPKGQQQFGEDGLAKVGEFVLSPGLRRVLVWEEGSSFLPFHIS